MMLQEHTMDAKEPIDDAKEHTDDASVLLLTSNVLRS